VMAVKSGYFSKPYSIIEMSSSLHIRFNLFIDGKSGSAGGKIQYIRRDSATLRIVM
jgi:hypothetical protein